MKEKQSIEKIAAPYLDELYDIFINEKILNNKNDSQLQTTSDSTQIETSQEPSNSKKLVRQLYDLQTIIRVTYRAVTNEGKELGNLLNYVEYFNLQKVIDIPLTDVKVKVLLEDIQNTSEDDISKEWSDAFAKNKIDITKIIHQLLAHMTMVRASQIGAAYEYNSSQSLNKQLTSDIILTATNDPNKTIQFEVKFRANISDLKSIALRSIKDYKNNALTYTKSTNRFVVLIYTYEQDHTFNRSIAQFNRVIVETDESLKDRISLIPISINASDGLSIKLKEYFEKINGLVLTFDYPDSPFQHGWSGPRTISKLNGVFRHLEDPEFKNVFGLDLPSSGNYYIDYKLNAYKTWNFQRVTFVIRPKIEFKFYVELSIKEDKNEYWFQILEGSKEPELKSTHGNFEYLVYSPFNDVRGWKYITIDVIEMFNKTFARYGGEFQRIEGVRLRGAIDVAKITFD